MASDWFLFKEMKGAIFYNILKYQKALEFNKMMQRHKLRQKSPQNRTDASVKSDVPSAKDHYKEKENNGKIIG